MKPWRACLLGIGGLIAATTVIEPAGHLQAAQQGAADVRRELGQLRKDIGRVARLIRDEEAEAAEKGLQSVQQRLDKLVQDSPLEQNHKPVVTLKKLINRQKALLSRMKDSDKSGDEKRGAENTSGGRVTYAEDVAPIFEKRCGKCHGANDPKARLNVVSYKGLQQGGQSGQVIVPRNPRQSLLVRRLLAPPQARMPKNGNRLPDREIQTIIQWINQGAKRGDNMEEMSEEGSENKKTDSPPIVINKASGSGTVSFTEEIAPFMANLCLGCHGGNNPRSGFSMATFRDLMKGGNSGRVIIPGNLEGSRLFRLVGGLENPRMPQGQARLTRENYEDLKTWIIEGARFDGNDPSTPLRQLVPSEEEMLEERLARLSPEEFAEHRLERAHEIWDRVLPKEEPRHIESEQFIVYGNVSESRLQQMEDWAGQHAGNLRKLFNENAKRLWKGKLTIFVMKDRFSYEEFNLVIHRRRAPEEMIGHSVVAPPFEDAYIVLQDVGDNVSADSPDMRINLIDHLTGAFLKRSKAKLPDWVIRGTGLAMASRSLSEASVYFNGLRATARKLAGGLNKPEDVVADGQFSPAGVGAIGYALVDFLLSNGGGSKYGRFIRGLQNGNKQAAALKAAYQMTPKALGVAFVRSLQSKGKRR